MGVPAFRFSGRLADFNSGISIQSGAEDAHKSRASGLTVVTPEGVGIRLGEDSVIKDCIIVAASPGILASNRSRIVDNQLTLTGENELNSGIVGGQDMIIINNTVRGAETDGISVSGNSIISSNHIVDSGHSGIYVAGNASIIERNIVYFNQNYGIEIDGTNNLVRANNARKIWDIHNSGLRKMWLS